jgi:cytochrome c553
MRILLTALALLGAAIVPARSESLRERLTPCLACHGENGQSENLEVPSLGAQLANYMLIQLFLFREKRRKVELMNEQAKDLTDDDLRQFSDFISKLPPPRPAEKEADALRIKRGAALIQQHHCNICHQLNLAGRDAIPRIAAQREDYLVRALREYKSNTRVGYEPIMLEVMRPLGEAEIADLAYTIARAR